MIVGYNSYLIYWELGFPALSYFFSDTIGWLQLSVIWYSSELHLLYTSVSIYCSSSQSLSKAYQKGRIKMGNNVFILMVYYCLVVIKMTIRELSEIIMQWWILKSNGTFTNENCLFLHMFLEWLLPRMVEIPLWTVR